MTGTAEGGRKLNEERSENSEKESAAMIERYLKGVSFPAEKEELIQQAKSNNAPEDVLRVLSRLKEKDYQTAIDVSKEVARVE